MGFYTRIIPQSLRGSPHFPPDKEFKLDDNDLVKVYFTIDNISFQSDVSWDPSVSDKEELDILVTLSTYNSYEERLVRGDLLMSRIFRMEDLIDKKFSENLWTKFYIKIKEIILNENTENLKEALILKERSRRISELSESFTNSDTESVITEPIYDSENIIIDTIPNEYQYLLEIDDHFN